MKRKLFLFALFTASLLSSFSHVSLAKEKPIVIITQDGEVDDRSSFVRFLLYTPDVDLRGIIATNSIWQRNGHGLSWVNEAIDLYGQVRPNLLLHNPDFPTVEFLKSIIMLGNEDPKHLVGGAPYVDSKGSDFIIKELLKKEEAPLHINCWGGANTVAHALWKLKKEHPEAYKQAASRARIYCVSFQDEAGKWIKDNLPEVMIIEAGSWDLSWNYHDKEPLKHNPYPEMMSSRWLNENIKNDHGVLGAWYPQRNISEGDTPAFLNFVDNGLEAYKDYGLGGWGGRFIATDGNYWEDAYDDNNRRKALWRWCPATQNDFAARMDWCTKSFEDANHAPTITVSTESRTVKRGEKVELKAYPMDIDGDRMYSQWWHYKQVTNTAEYVEIINETSAEQAYFIVPKKQKDDIHIILEITDDGTPALKRYKRLIFKVD